MDKLIDRFKYKFNVIFRTSKYKLAEIFNDELKNKIKDKFRDKKFLKIIAGVLIAVFVLSASFLSYEKATVSAVEPEPTELMEEEVEPEVEEIEEVEEIDERIIIMIDPGHGGVDPGTPWEEVNEKDINLDISLYLRDILLEKGFNVHMTRDTDVTVSPDKRVALANDSNASLLISIHQNSFKSDLSVHGIETIYFENEDLDSKNFAMAIQESIMSVMETRDRGIIARNDLVILREATMTACLIESGYLSNAQERENLLNEETQRKIAESIAIGVENYLKPLEEAEELEPEKIMQLTFDDGPVQNTTPAVLDVLKERNIKATFFVVGSNVERNPEIAKRIVEEGHAIGVHTYSHIYREIYESVEAYMADFTRASDIIETATGLRPTIFRFPGGSVNSHNKNVYRDIIEEMTQQGYIYYDWNASLEDSTRGATAESILDSALKTVKERNHVILLAHDTISATAEVLNELIDLFYDEYNFAIISDEYAPIQFKFK